MKEINRQAALFETQQHATTEKPASNHRRAGQLPVASRQPSRRWLCLYFPDLPLEAIRTDTQRLPVAVVDDQGKAARLLNCNRLAAGQAVIPGLPVNAALALCPELQLLQRDRRREQQLLKSLAALMLQFTPSVCLASPEALLLEISGSLRLFGGSEVLLERVSLLLRARGHRFQLAAAPTALASLWLARAGASRLPAGIAELPAVLAGLALKHLRWPPATLRMLTEMGVYTLGDCIRLPRAGLARRLGPARLQELDQAYGRVPETCKWYVPAASFRQTLEMPAETVELAQINQAIEDLVTRLAGCLRRHQRSLRELWLCFEHNGCAPTLLRIGFLEAVTDQARLLDVLRVRLAAARLPSATTAITLQARLGDEAVTATADLLTSGVTPVETLAALLERLRARLGPAAVHGLRVLAEHRPEYAWQPVDEPATAGSLAHGLPPAPYRPLWILPEPLRLEELQNQPVFHDRLLLDDGPERIETGWWDGNDVRRDYYRARNGQGMRLWVFRDLRQGGWYLHGLFG